MRKRIEENRKLKQYERIQNTENAVEEIIGVGKLFELATSNKLYVDGLIYMR